MGTDPSNNYEERRGLRKLQEGRKKKPSGIPASLRVWDSGNMGWRTSAFLCLRQGLVSVDQHYFIGS